MKNLLPIVPSYLLEFPLPTLSRLSNSLSSKSYENIPTLTTTNNMVMLSSGKTTSTSSLPNPEMYSSYPFDQVQCSNSPASTTSSPATSGLVGDFKTLTSNISGVISKNSLNECMDSSIVTMTSEPSNSDNISTSEPSTKQVTSCTSNAVNPNNSFTILVS